MKDRIIKLKLPQTITLAAITALDLFLAKFTEDKAGVDRAWNELFDPGDPQAYALPLSFTTRALFSGTRTLEETRCPDG